MNMNRLKDKLLKLDLKKIDKLLNIALILVIIAIFITGGVVVHGATIKRGIDGQAINKQHSLEGKGQANSELQSAKFSNAESINILQDTILNIGDSFISTFADYGKLTDLGEFEITAYTAGFESCQKLESDSTYGQPKISGSTIVDYETVYAQENHTIASDWSVLPPLTRVKIEGLPYIYTVEDIGPGIVGKELDLYISNLDEANEWGRQTRKVWLVEAD